LLVNQAAHGNCGDLADNEVIKAVEKRTATAGTKGRQLRIESRHTPNKGATSGAGDDPPLAKGCRAIAAVRFAAALIQVARDASFLHFIPANDARAT
jgi:hypothetical protein